MLLARAREMRKEPTPAEEKLWYFLRDRRLCDLKFRRQTPSSPYITDFYCASAKLVVELDGDSHAGREEYDQRRTRWMQSRGVRVIRFTNQDVYESLDAVLERIASFCGVDM